MLCLSRNVGESIVIGGNISVAIDEVRGDRVRLAIDAPCEISVNRSEVEKAICRQHGDRRHNPSSPPPGVHQRTLKERLDRIAQLIGNNLTLDAEQTAAVRRLAGGGK